MNRKCELLVFLFCMSFVILSSSESNHPMLFFSEEDLPKMREKAESSHRRITALIKIAGQRLKTKSKDYLPPESFETFGSKWNERYGNSLCTFAFYCTLYPGDEEAFNLIKTYMDRMASYPDWYVTSSRGNDEVPIGHSLTGFATAYDFLHGRFEDERKKVYLEKIVEVTSNMYRLMRSKWKAWAREHTHNHAPTNIVAVLQGALVAKKHEVEKANVWKEKAVELLEIGLRTLQLIPDGSSDEGVAYASYAARGWMQYIFLAKRHLGVTHENHPWLRNHFWLYYSTVLPGYYGSVGIADSNANWFHGPCSQLVFLDAFVMKNGYGNWLADRIRESRMEKKLFLPDWTHEYSTVHLEFIFYDERIQARPPPKHFEKLHFFHDWGVVTYGGGQALKDGNSFLSFKSGAVNGEAIADSVEQRLFSDIIRPWASINSGHEHPDQNSFTFAPNGRRFITEALYGPKFTHLNNVLTFSPSKSAQCHEPWEGQIGECSKWLNYEHVPVPRGKVVTATNCGDMVHIAGEAVDAYSSELALESVQRSMVLLNPEVLIVVDSVYLSTRSHLRKASAFFHNIDSAFRQTQFQQLNGAEILHEDGSYRFVWQLCGGDSPKPTLHEEAIATEGPPRTTHYVNVTFPLKPGKLTRMAYVFFGPNSKVESIHCPKTGPDHIIKFSAKVNGIHYKLTSMPLNATLKTRNEFLGFGGYLRVENNNSTYYFGMGDNCNLKDYPQTPVFLKELRLPVLSSSGKVTEKEECFSKSSVWHCVFLYSFFVYFIIIIRTKSDRYYKRYYVFCFLVLSVTWMVVTLYFSTRAACGPASTDSTETEQAIAENKLLTAPKASLPILPMVVITSLPGSGSEILETVFLNSSDFTYLSTHDVTIPVPDDATKFNPCYWPKNDIKFLETKSKTAGWFLSMKTEPLSFFNNIPEKNPRVSYARRRIRELTKNSSPAINLLNGYWNTKISWLNEVLGEQMRSVYVVRDPRDWIYSLIRDDLTMDKMRIQQVLLRNFLHPETCRSPTWLPRPYRQTQSHVTDNLIEILSMVWKADVKTVIGNAKSLHIVRFEDILTDPHKTAAKLLMQYGITISLPQINRITRAAHSGFYNIYYEGPLHRDYAGQWRGKMTLKDVKIIEDICRNLMKQLSYL
ncbi:dermatan-sulfate epimerase-like protein [Clavelina lepadiformis]|uniref:dermatan-sulfate epimerase-like protein n=1 Tax=Clavelina lepadiformis TaxID=159417 RepID=UPI004041DC54